MLFRFALKAGVLTALLSAQTLAAPDSLARFTVADVHFELGIPRGFCLPPADFAPAAKAMAAADDRNVTDLLLILCAGKGNDRMAEYTVIKTPYQALTRVTSREELIKMMAPLANDVDAVISADDLHAGTERKWKGVGFDIKFSGVPHMLGHDDVCVYLGGETTVSGSDGKPFPMRIAGCMTSAGGKMISVTRYADTARNKTIPALAREARAIALAVRAVPAAN